MKDWLKKEMRQEGQLAIIASVLVGSVTLTASTLVFYFTQYTSQNDKINTVATDVAVIREQVATQGQDLQDIKSYFKPNAK